MVFVKPFGPHHCATCARSIHALNTSSRGASKTRVRTISRSDVAIASLPVAAIAPAPRRVAGRRRDDRSKQFGHALPALACADFHPGLEHSVAIRCGLEERPDRDPRPAVEIFERHGGDHYVARHRSESEGGDDGLTRHDLPEHAVEKKLVAVCRERAESPEDSWLLIQLVIA